jgi:hypothetical protein
MSDEKKNGLMPFNPQMMQMFQGGGLTSPSQDREFTTNNSWFTLALNKSKSKKLEEIEVSRGIAVSARTRAIRDIMDLMHDMARAGDILYQEKYRDEHERKMMDLQEEMTRHQITSLELDNMLKKVKVEQNFADLDISKFENQLKRLQLQKRIDNNDF